MSPNFDQSQRTVLGLHNETLQHVYGAESEGGRYGYVSSPDRESVPSYVGATPSPYGSVRSNPLRAMASRQDSANSGQTAAHPADVRSNPMPFSFSAPDARTQYRYSPQRFPAIKKDAGAYKYGGDEAMPVHYGGYDGQTNRGTGGPDEGLRPQRVHVPILKLHEYSKSTRIYSTDGRSGFRDARDGEYANYLVSSAHTHVTTGQTDMRSAYHARLLDSESVHKDTFLSAMSDSDTALLRVGAVAEAVDGCILVADTGRCRVACYTLSGLLLRTRCFGERGRGRGQFEVCTKDLCFVLVDILVVWMVMNVFFIWYVCFVCLFCLFWFFC
jgi:hypothetical protein